MQIDRAEQATPSATRKELTRFGGLNPYGRANWRLVLAEHRLVKRGGIFKTMPSGNVATMEIDPRTFEIHRREVTPEKVETGYRDVPKYPVRGWILERWFPASKYGSRQAWEREMSSDGLTPMLGPYPFEGDYFMLAGPFEHSPEIGDLKTAISMHIREEESQPTNYATMIVNEINQDAERVERQWRKYEEDLAHFYESEVDPVLKSGSLEAQRIRQDLAQQMGDFTHQAIQ